MRRPLQSVLLLAACWVVFWSQRGSAAVVVFAQQPPGGTVDAAGLEVVELRPTFSVVVGGGGSCSSGVTSADRA